MARIAYFYREMSDYIANDLDLLRDRHQVSATGCTSRWPNPLALLRQVAGCDVVMAWFASWHSFWPVLLAWALGKPSVVTVGGYDTASLPEIDYGHQRGGLRRWIALTTMRLATRLIVISDATRSEVLALGLPERNLVRLHLGLDPARYAGAVVAPEPRVITVAGVNRSNLTRKGLEAFVRAAALCPELEFVVVGGWTDDAVERLFEIATANVHFTGRVTHVEKVARLRRSRVVVQASQHEAFGLSLAEGMLCGCVPVVTRAGSLPEVAGDCGVIVDGQDPGAIARGVREAHAIWPAGGRRARERVVECFSMGRRRRGLEDLIAALAPSSVCEPALPAPAAVAARGSRPEAISGSHSPQPSMHRSAERSPGKIST